MPLWLARRRSVWHRRPADRVPAHSIPMPEGLENPRIHFVLTGMVEVRSTRLCGRLVLFYAAASPARNTGFDPLLGWKGCAADGVEMRLCGRRSSTMLHSPAVRDLVAHLTPYLRHGLGLKRHDGRFFSRNPDISPAR